MPELGTLDQAKVASLAGLAPVARQSGQWIGSALIRGGLANVRRSLYMPALVAIQHEAAITQRYRHMVDARGKPKMIAVVAIMRKLLLCLHGMLKTDTPFDPAKLASRTELENPAVLITA